MILLEIMRKQALQKFTRNIKSFYILQATQGSTPYSLSLASLLNEEIFS